MNRTSTPLSVICDEPWKRPVVRVNGDVLPCCKCLEVMGNLNDASFKDIWYGAAYQKFRRDILLGDTCQHCVKWRSRAVLPALGRWKAGSYPQEAPFGLGWYDIGRKENRAWRWTSKRAILFLMRPPGHGRLKIQYFGIVDSDITILLNGEAVGSFKTTAGKREILEIDIGTAHNAGLVHVELRASNTLTTMKDLRRIGVAVEEIEFQGGTESAEDYPSLTRFDSFLNTMCNGNIPLPQTVLCELSTRCNFSCAMCIKSAADRKADRDMDFELYRRVAEEIFDSIDVVHLAHIGESMLHPRFGDMLLLAKEHGVGTDITTNASMIDEKTARVLVEGLNNMQVSIDGLRETYNRIRRGGDFDAVIGNLKTLARIKKKTGSSCPRINISFVAMKCNIHELPKLIDMLGREGLGIERVSVLQFAEYKEVRNESLRGHEHLARRCYTKALRVAQRHGIALELLPPYQWGEDFKPRTQSGILTRMVRRCRSKAGKFLSRIVEGPATRKE